MVQIPERLNPKTAGVCRGTLVRIEEAGEGQWQVELRLISGQTQKLKVLASSYVGTFIEGKHLVVSYEKRPLTGYTVTAVSLE